MAYCPPRKHPSPYLQRRPPPEYWPAGSFLDFLFRPQSSGSGWGLAIGLARGCRPGLPGSTICMGPGARQVASRPRDWWPGPWRKAAPPRVWCLSDLHLGDRPRPPNPSPFLGIGQVGGDETCDTTHTHAMGVLPTWFADISLAKPKRRVCLVRRWEDSLSLSAFSVLTNPPIPAPTCARSRWPRVTARM